jgi:hypothetical protein
MPTAHLPHRSVFEVSGEDRVAFLQGLVSGDVAAARPDRAVWAALLTPQGRWFADFFITDAGDRLLLETEAMRVEAIRVRLSRFRLRSRVALALRPDLSVFAGWNGPVPPGATPDPRLSEAGWRLVAPDAATDAPTRAWNAHRLALGLPDGAPDLEPEHSLLLEAGFDELGGVAWEKGCYMGQELTARTRYRGLLKRRLVPVTVDGELPAPGTPVMRGGAEMGTLRSGQERQALATLRLEALDGAGLACGGAVLRPHIPAWMRLPQPAAA